MPGERNEQSRAALRAKLTPEQLAELTDLESPEKQRNLDIENRYLDAKQKLRNREEAGRLTPSQYREQLATLEKQYRKLRLDQSSESKSL